MPILNDQVREFWEKEPCGTGAPMVGALSPETPEWFRQVEEYRYKLEPFIHSVAQFTRHCGKRMLEIGVGAGTDHLQWARAGLDCYGVDLTDAAIETTRKHLALHGRTSNLQRLNAEALPFGNDFFDLVYSWGVIHHSESPAKIVGEIHRILKPGGRFIGMMYGRRSSVVFKLWVRHALLRGKPWRSFGDVVWHSMESIGTKAYTPAELRLLFRGFRDLEIIPILTEADRARWPRWLASCFPDKWGWFIGLRATK